MIRSLVTLRKYKDKYALCEANGLLCADSRITGWTKFTKQNKIEWLQIFVLFLMERSSFNRYFSTYSRFKIQHAATGNRNLFPVKIRNWTLQSISDWQDYLQCITVRSRWNLVLHYAFMNNDKISSHKDGYRLCKFLIIFRSLTDIWSRQYLQKKKK